MRPSPNRSSCCRITACPPGKCTPRCCTAFRPDKRCRSRRSFWHRRRYLHNPWRSRSRFVGRAHNDTPPPCTSGRFRIFDHSRRNSRDQSRYRHNPWPTRSKSVRRPRRHTGRLDTSDWGRSRDHTLRSDCGFAECLHSAGPRHRKARLDSGSCRPRSGIARSLGTCGHIRRNWRYPWSSRCSGPTRHSSCAPPYSHTHHRDRLARPGISAGNRRSVSCPFASRRSCCRRRRDLALGRRIHLPRNLDPCCRPNRSCRSSEHHQRPDRPRCSSGHSHTGIRHRCKSHRWRRRCRTLHNLPRLS